MKNYQKSFRLTGALIGIVLIAAAVFAVGTSSLTKFRTARVPKDAIITAKADNPPQDPSAKNNENDDKGFWLMLGPYGFEVNEMTITSGNYFVVIQNATGLDEFAININKKSGERVQEERPERFRKTIKKMMHFSSGEYIVTEVNHPEWTCKITVN